MVYGFTSYNSVYVFSLKEKQEILYAKVLDYKWLRECYVSGKYKDSHIW